MGASGTERWHYAVVHRWAAAALALVLVAAAAVAIWASWPITDELGRSCGGGVFGTSVERVNDDSYLDVCNGLRDQRSCASTLHASTSTAATGGQSWRPGVRSPPQSHTRPGKSRSHVATPRGSQTQSRGTKAPGRLVGDSPSGPRGPRADARRDPGSHRRADSNLGYVRGARGVSRAASAAPHEMHVERPSGNSGARTLRGHPDR